MTSDGEVLARWWAEVQERGRLPAGVEAVQGRLVREVGRAALPSGPVFLKVMSFPRPKDKLRYLLRPLPAAHEARLLQRVAAAGVPCPEVVAVRTSRRWLLPHRSLLVLRALPAAGPAGAVRETDLADRAALAVRLLAAGVFHGDLNAGNFLRLADGRLAVLDLQSARAFGGPPGDRRRLALAARLLRDDAGLGGEAAAGALQAAGLLRDPGEVAAARVEAAAEQRRFLQGRIHRCLEESTEFVRRLRPAGRLHSCRGEQPAGRWHRGGPELLAAWLGQRALQVMEGRPPVLFALFRPWWWLPLAHSVYIAGPAGESRDPDWMGPLLRACDRYQDLVPGGGVGLRSTKVVEQKDVGAHQQGEGRNG